MITPKVSVIMPVYNGEKYLEQCMDSVCAQSMKEIEIICVDDGSSDRSLGILQKYADKDSRVKIITQQNGGAGKARNTGMKKATGEYLIFLDSDDFFEKDMIAKAYEEAEQYQADFVVFNSDQYHMDTKKYVQNPWVVRKRDIPPYMPFSFRELTDNVFKTFVGWAWDKLYKRSFVEKHGLYFQEQRTTNDMLFVFSSIVLAEKIVFLDEILVHQRRGGKESLSVTREKSWFCFYDALIALRNRLKNENLYWLLEKDYINYALHFALWNYKTLKEPTKKLLHDKLSQEWFAELGIADKPQKYFYNQAEYKEYMELFKK